MGACCSCSPHGSKVAPLDNEVPKKVSDNFVRGRGDGESDAEKSKDKSPTLDRYLSGSSFSSKSCASKSVDELDVSDEKYGEEEIFGLLNIKNRGSTYDVLSEKNSEIKTEGGLTDVSLDMNHPFAPSYKDTEQLNVNELSRPRSKGMRGRSSYTRDLLSQLSNYSDIDYPCDTPIREDTPVPGKRSGSNMSILSKRKHKRKGNLTSCSRKSNISALSLYDGDDNSNNSTPRSLQNSTPGGISLTSSIVIRTDDGGSSLTSSCASLSAIGEMSESSSVRSSVKRKETIKRSNITSQNNKVKVCNMFILCSSVYL
jgi:hypothetical protein